MFKQEETMVRLKDVSLASRNFALFLFTSACEISLQKIQATLQMRLF